MAKTQKTHRTDPPHTGEVEKLQAELARLKKTRYDLAKARRALRRERFLAIPRRQRLRSLGQEAVTLEEVAPMLGVEDARTAKRVLRRWGVPLLPTTAGRYLLVVDLLINVAREKSLEMFDDDDPAACPA